MSNILNLVLKHKWYDMIASDEKLEEYREITHHWMSRLFFPGDYYHLWNPLRKYRMDAGMVEDLKNQIYETAEMRFRDYKYVKFHRGYTSTTMTFEIESISIGQGREDWGAEPGKEYFVIKLKRRR